MPETMESAVSNTPFAAASTATAAEEESTRRVANRIIRALQHQLRLLHRAGEEFFVLGATGNVYTVTLSTTPACTCPDTAVPCKHILFVLLRVLGLSLDEACVWRQSLRPCQVARLVGAPTCYPDVLAGARARERFHQLWSARPASGAASPTAPAGRRRRPQCFARWKRSRARRAATCVVCRSRWRQPRREKEEQRYMNLAAYMNDDGDAMQCDDDGGLCAG
ncbi:hypothetical protein EJB05_41206, partial [Eragrostis curvula]